MKEIKMIPEKHFNMMTISWVIMVIAFLLMWNNAHKAQHAGEDIAEKYLDHMVKYHPELSE